MALPRATRSEDIKGIAKYLITKPTGATFKELKAVLGPKIIDARKIAAFQILKVVSREGDRVKLTSDVGRRMGRGGDEEFSKVLLLQIGQIPAYKGVLEWAHHNGLSELAASEVGAHWHEHYRSELGTDTDSEIGFRAVCFLQLCGGAGLGRFVMGRRGQESRLVVHREVLGAFARGEGMPPMVADTPEIVETRPVEEGPAVPTERRAEAELGKAIFIGHGKNKKPLEQLKKMLKQFDIPCRVAVEEPNLGRPIGGKIRETMQACNCAIFIFTADEEFKDKDGNVVWRTSQNVIYELGAAGYLYDKRIVIMKEDKVELPSDFKELCYINFSADKIGEATMDILKELVAFGILRFVT